VQRRPRFLLTFLAWTRGLSGGDRHLLEVGARWHEHVDLTVLAPPQAAATIRPFLGDVRIHPLGSAGTAQARLGPLLALEYVRRAVEASVRDLPRTDVVVTASHFVPDAAGLAACARRGALGVSYVYHLIAERSGYSLRTLWSKNDERVALALLRRHADVVFTSNRTTAAALGARGFEPVHTAVGIDFAAFLQASPARSAPRGAFIARLVHTKGVVDAVRAWAQVLRSVPDAKLVIVGAGPERERAAALAEQLGIAGSLEWRGFVSEEEKRRILADSRLLLAPSYEEGWGISVCEALASGLPVVAYRLPVLDELFGASYVGARLGDVTDLAESAVRILTTDSIAEDLSHRGRETASRYDVRRVADSELDVILARSAACAS
jgi:glycosyltransferase involved in cell wall biosynthesis